jgi:hypothetical protein
VPGSGIFANPQFRDRVATIGGMSPLRRAHPLYLDFDSFYAVTLFWPNYLTKIAEVKASTRVAAARTCEPSPRGAATRREVRDCQHKFTALCATDMQRMTKIKDADLSRPETLLQIKTNHVRARSSNWIEQGTPKPKVASSILAGRTSKNPYSIKVFSVSACLRSKEAGRTPDPFFLRWLSGTSER